MSRHPETGPARSIAGRAVFLLALLAAAGGLYCHDFVLGGGVSPGPPRAPGGDQGPNTHPPKDEPRIQKDTEGADPGNGGFVFARTDVCVRGKGGLLLDITFVYRSLSAVNRFWGYGWDMSWDRRLRKLANGNVLASRGDNTRQEYVRTGPGTYAAPSGVQEQFVENANGTFALVHKHGSIENYDTNGNIVSFQDRNGNALTFAYDPAGPQPITGPSAYFVNQPQGVIVRDFRLASITDAAGRVVSLGYGNEGRLASIGYLGRIIHYGMDQAGDQTCVTLPATPGAPQGSTTSHTYDSCHNLLTVTDPLGHTTLTNVFNVHDRLIQQTIGTGTTQIAYFDAAGQPAGAGPVAFAVVTDRVGNITRYDFTGGRIVRIEDFTDGNPPGEPPSYVTAINFDAAGNRTRIQYARGDAVECAYDARANVTEVRQKRLGVPAGQNDPTDLVTTLTYHPIFNRPTSVTDPRGHSTSFSHDANGNLIQVTFPPVAGSTAQATFTHDAAGQPLTFTDPNGNVTRNSYDAVMGDLVQVIRGFGTAAAAATSFSYDASGNAVSVTDPNGNIRLAAYDAQDQLIRTTAPPPFGFQTSYRYDAAGNLVQVDEQAKASFPGPLPALGQAAPGDNWRSTVFARDVLGRLTGITNDAGAVWSATYDANGNRLTTTDPLGNVTIRDYEERDLLARVVDAAGGATGSDYDADGNLVRITDANGQATQYTPDDFGRCIRVTYPDAAFEAWTYDPAGNMTSKTNARGQTITFVRDARNRLSSKTTPEEATTYGYDVGNRLLSAADADATITWTYNPLDQVLSQTTTPAQGGNPATVSFVNDPGGRCTRYVLPDGSAVNRIHDQLNRAVRVSAFGGQVQASLEYDALGQLVGIQRGNGVRTDILYDSAGNALETVHRGPQGGLIERIFEAYNTNGLARALSDAAGRHRFSQDAAGRPTSETHPSGFAFPSSTTTFDPAGNPLTVAQATGTVTFVVNGLNQIVNAGGTPLIYDLDGNQISDGVSTTAYDSQNRPTQYQPSGGAPAALRFGPDGNLYLSGDSGAERRIYTGNGLLAKVDSVGNTTARFVHAGGVTPLAFSTGTNVFYLLTDARNTVSHLTNGTGQVLESYDYSANGGRSPQVSAFGNGFGFRGLFHDPTSGRLHDGGPRFISPDPAARLTSRDPYITPPGDTLGPFSALSGTSMAEPHVAGSAVATLGSALGLRVTDNASTSIADDFNPYSAYRVVSDPLAPGTDDPFSPESRDALFGNDSFIYRSIETTERAQSMLAPDPLEEFGVWTDFEVNVRSLSGGTGAIIGSKYFLSTSANRWSVRPFYFDPRFTEGGAKWFFPSMPRRVETSEGRVFNWSVLIDEANDFENPRRDCVR